MSFAGIVSSTTRPKRRFIRQSLRATACLGCYKPQRTDFVKSFYAVLERWERATGFSSNPHEITTHPSYQALVANAQVAAPLILAELRKQPSPLVWVLDDAFPHERPYSDSAVGDIEEMTKAWLIWGDQHGRTL